MFVQTKVPLVDDATDRSRLVECVTPPPEALRVTIPVPRHAVTGQEVEAEKETVTEQVGVHPLLVNVGEMFEGSPIAENVKGTPVPAVSVAVSDVEGLVPPCITVKLGGEGAERLKSGPETVTPRLNVLLLETCTSSPL